MQSGSAQEHGIPRWQRGMHTSQAGFTFVWVLAVLAILALGLAAVGPSWQRDAQRDKETELLRIGSLYARALGAYWAQSPGSQKQYPSKLQELTQDPRFIGTVRHIRKLYADPMAPDLPWGIVRNANGQITGVYSQSQQTPLRQELLVLGEVRLPIAQRYDLWKFSPKITP